VFLYSKISPWFSKIIFFAADHNLLEESRKMVASAFGDDQSGGSATRLTVEDLKYLFMF
jgi:hypothetical protein